MNKIFFTWCFYGLSLAMDPPAIDEGEETMETGHAIQSTTVAIHKDVAAVVQPSAERAQEQSPSQLAALEAPWEDSTALQAVRAAYMELRGFELLLVAQGAMEIVKQRMIVALCLQQMLHAVEAFQNMMSEDKEAIKAKMHSVKSSMDKGLEELKKKADRITESIQVNKQKKE